MKHIIKSIIDGNDIDEDDFEATWQEFALKRQEKIDKKTDGILQKEINQCLDQISNSKLKNNLTEICIKRESKLTYDFYCQGFLDGIKQIILLNHR